MRGHMWQNKVASVLGPKEEVGGSCPQTVGKSIWGSVATPPPQGHWVQKSMQATGGLESTLLDTII